MKIRQGFVSNSSSSSFVIAADSELKSEDLKCKITIDVSVNDFIHQTITNFEELQEYLLEYQGWGHDDFTTFIKESSEGESTYLEYSKLLEQGKKIFVGSVSSEGYEGVESYICDNGWENASYKNFKFLEGEEGGY